MTPWGRVSEFARAELRLAVPAQFGFWHLLSFMIIALLSIEILSGILLMVYYRPSSEEAYASLRYIMNDVQLGWFIRGVHKWSADLLVFFLFVHMARIFVQRAYQERALNWGIGLLLLLFTGAFAFTGTLLIWDQSAFWSTDAARQIIQGVPILGNAILNLLWGGEDLEAAALLRFYVFHVGLLPWITIAILMVHLYFVRRKGFFDTSGQPIPPTKNLRERNYADVILDGLLMVFFVLGILLTLTVLLTPSLGDSIDSLKPVPVTVAWYFLPIYGLFKLSAGSLGLFFLVIGVLALFFIPLLSRVTKTIQKWLIPAVGLFILTTVVLLGIWGYWQGGFP